MKHYKWKLFKGTVSYSHEQYLISLNVSQSIFYAQKWLQQVFPQLETLNLLPIKVKLALKYIYIFIKIGYVPLQIGYEVKRLLPYVKFIY